MITQIRYISSSPNFTGRNTVRYFDEYDDPLENEIIPEYEALDSKYNTDSEDIFRTDELFDIRKGDYVTELDRCYGDEDDIPFCDNITMRILPKDWYYASNCVESRCNETEYFRNYNYTKTIYSADNAYEEHKESIQERMNQGFKKEDIVKIYHSGLINQYDHKVMDYKLVKAGFNLLSNGTPVDRVTKIMDGSKLSYADGSSRTNMDLFNFLTVYPDSRETLVEKHSNYEYFRKDIVDTYADITEACSNTKDAELIIDACRTYRNGKMYLDQDMVDLCFDKIKKEEPLEKTTNIIKDSKLDIGQGNQIISGELFDFLSEYPEGRIFVVENTDNGEKFRPDIAEIYPSIKQVCKKSSDIKSIINTCQVGKEPNFSIDSEMTNICIDTIKNGKPLCDTLKYLDEAKLYKTGRTEFCKPLYEFLEKYPDARDAVVKKSQSQKEIFRPDRAEAYPIFLNACKYDDEIPLVMDACETGRNKDRQEVNPQLTDLALNLLALNSEWSDNQDTIMDRVIHHFANGRRDINENKYEIAKTMSKGNYSIGSIYSVIVLNNKNVELCK